MQLWAAFIHTHLSPSPPCSCTRFQVGCDAPGGKFQVCIQGIGQCRKVHWGWHTACSVAVQISSIFKCTDSLRCHNKGENRINKSAANPLLYWGQEISPSVCHKWILWKSGSHPCWAPGSASCFKELCVTCTQAMWQSVIAFLEIGIGLCLFPFDITGDSWGSAVFAKEIMVGWWLFSLRKCRF